MTVKWSELCSVAVAQMTSIMGLRAVAWRSISSTGMYGAIERTATGDGPIQVEGLPGNIEVVDIDDELAHHKRQGGH